VAQIHLYVLPAAAWDEQLAFRDALRADPALATAYAAEKYRVAAEVAWSKGAYSVAKGPFVERALATLRADGRLRDISPAHQRIVAAAEGAHVSDRSHVSSHTPSQLDSSIGAKPGSTEIE
jgi:hypothetical protein